MAPLLLASLLVRGAFAQPPLAPSSWTMESRNRIQSSIDYHVQQLTKALDLSETQQSAIKKILERRQFQMWSLRRDPSITGSARIDRFRTIQLHTVDQVRGVLSDEQKEKYDPLAVRKLQPAPGQRTVEDWLNLTTPH